jgi:hypothetical protein
VSDQGVVAARPASGFGRKKLENLPNTILPALGEVGDILTRRDVGLADASLLMPRSKPAVYSLVSAQTVD